MNKANITVTHDGQEVATLEFTELPTPDYQGFEEGHFESGVQEILKHVGYLYSVAPKVRISITMKNWTE